MTRIVPSLAPWVALLGLAGCPVRPSVSVDRAPSGPVAAPRPPCTVKRLEPRVSGVSPDVTIGGGRVAVAWLELGEHEGLHVGTEDLGASHPSLPIEPPEMAPGWHDLAAPHLAAAASGFTLAFAGNAPDGKAGVALADVAPDGTPSPPRLVLAAPGARTAAVLARPRGGFLVGWYPFVGSDAAGDRAMTLARLDGRDRVEGATVLGGVPVDTALSLVRDGGLVHAAWAGVDPSDPRARALVYVGAFDETGAPARPARALGEGVSPSLALLDSSLLVEYERESDGATWYGRPGDPGGWADGEDGAVATLRGGALLCTLARHIGDDGDASVPRCVRLDGNGRPGPAFDLDVPAGADLSNLAVAGDGTRAAATWQRDDSDGNSTVGVAVVDCR